MNVHERMNPYALRPDGPWDRPRLTAVPVFAQTLKVFSLARRRRFALVVEVFCY
jgi:hypothetical protein